MPSQLYDITRWGKMCFGEDRVKVDTLSSDGRDARCSM